MTFRVHPAIPYGPGLYSLGDAQGMLLRQYRFPDTYDARDTFWAADHDRLDFTYACRCFQRHLDGQGPGAFRGWLRRKSTTPEEVFALLKDLLQPPAEVVWTGFRVLGSVHLGNGETIYTMALFAKHPDSGTKVYSGERAPNVRRKQQQYVTGGFGYHPSGVRETEE